MACCSPNRLDGQSGFATPVFAALSLALAVTAGATLMLADAERAAALRSWKATQAFYELEGFTNLAAWRLLSEPGAPTLQWNETSSLGELRISVEPEALKLNPTEAAREQNEKALSTLFGETAGPEISSALASLQSVDDQPITAAQIVGVSQNPRWRRCGPTFVSPYTRLTAIALPAVRTPGSGTDQNLRAGEVWRVVVEAATGRWMDRMIRFTGDPNEAVRTVDQAFGVDRSRLSTNCLAMTGLLEKPA